MKKNFILFLLLLVSTYGFAQYIGLKARYTATRLVDDFPRPPKRENRLVLSFYEVSATGVYSPTVLTNHDIWVYLHGFQYGSDCGGVLDSCGNNYPGYSWTAPKVISYHNSYNPHAIDCDVNLATHFVVNGHELDCGFVPVSHWETDQGTGVLFEAFTAPNVFLRYYHPWDVPYGIMPGNVNFQFPIPASPPYNWYSLVCNQSTQQLVIRGVLPHDNSQITLPVRFADVRAEVQNDNRVKLYWSNLTETDVHLYEVERSRNGMDFQTAGVVFPLHNNGGRADYGFIDPPVANGAWYYRIKVTETTGRVVFSLVMRIQYDTGKSPSLKVYPNPTSQSTIHLQLHRVPAGRYQLLLADAAGRSHLITKIIHTGGSITQVVDLPTIGTGVYQLILRSDEALFAVRVVIGSK